MSNENKNNFILFDNPLSQYPYQTNNNLIEKISLSPKEKEIFSILKQILEKNNLIDTIFRVAGGWVRDKLLNKENIDIDIAINNKKGYEIAKLINDELYPKKNKIGLIQQALSTYAGWIFVIILPALAVVAYDILKLFERIKNHKRSEKRKKRLISPDVVLEG